MFKVMAASAVFSFLVFTAVEPTARAAPAAAQSDPKNLYVVVLRQSPAATYAGNLRGFTATKPPKGKRLDKRSPEVARYTAHLTTQHDSLLNSVGGARKLYSYSFALNGFAAELTAAQAAKLRADPNVIAVVRNEIRKLDTLTIPAFLGLGAPNGAWAQLGGGSRAGDNVIVGVIDTGIWPEHPSFAPRPVHSGPPPGWSGICQAGQEFPASTCNNKLIGARWYNAGFGGDAAIQSLFAYEFLSARAADGHGVHTASTAVGNYLVKAEAGGVALGRISGMAPAARLAVYKACWGFEDDPEAGCATVDSVAAIDQAVADGVDVINFSIGGSLTSFVDPVEFAFLLAADAGVFVATSAGNEGLEGPRTVAHNSPWVTTVAMGTHDRRYDARVIFTSGVRFRGVSLDDTGVGNHRVVLSSAAGLPGQDATLVALCFPGALDPALVAGKIVVCDRGENARVQKSQVVADAGGVGMILVNTSPNTLNADIHSVPTVHVDELVGAALKSYLARNPNLEARLTRRAIVTGPQVPAPNLSAESSRGPALAGGGDVLKPDLLAPGIPVLAAYSPVRTGHDFEFLGGTSMSSALIAGVAAFIRQQHPDWSPAAVKSALMTTATPLRNDGQPIAEDADGTPANPLGFGAGFVQPNEAMNPGLVYDAAGVDWLQFICGTGEACFPPFGAIDPSDLNYPSISIGGLVGQQTIRRTVTHVGARTSQYSVQVQAPPGVNVTVSPSSFTIAPGASRTYQVRFSRSGAPLDQFAFGSLVWSDGRHTVRSPVVIRPAPLAAPGEVRGTGGNISYTMAFGYTGSFKAIARGLIPARTNQRVVQDDPANDINTALANGRGIKLITVPVSAGTTYARFSLFDTHTDGSDDLDLYVFDADGAFVAGSAAGGSNEEVNLLNPAPGTYQVIVHGYETDGPNARFTLFSWALGSAAAGNMSVTAPAGAKLNGNGVVSLVFSKLQPGVKYLGSVAYAGATGMPNPTIVRVDR